MPGQRLNSPAQHKYNERESERIRLAGSPKLAALKLKGRQLLLVIESQNIKTGESCQAKETSYLYLLPSLTL